VIRAATLIPLLVLAACGGDPTGDPLQFTVPRGASLHDVTDTLVARGIVERPPLFRAYVRIRRADRSLKAGIYRLRSGEAWADVVDVLSEGRVIALPMTIPEGWRLTQMVPRIAATTGLPPDTVRARLLQDSAHVRWRVPGPGLEGFLFPDTYRFTPGSSLDAVIGAMTDRYKSYWSAERRAQLEPTGLSEQEAVTLASIVQAEARRLDEMPTIAAVYLNRVRRGFPLQADPTVLYALGGYRARLLFAAIDSVADHPYNTYARAGLPPGPIGAPGDAALDAVLTPADVDYMYFVARPDGSHTFTRTLTEHNRAVALARRAWDSVEAGAIPRPALTPPPTRPSGG
jgi:UPF0755 protein